MISRSAFGFIFVISTLLPINIALGAPCGKSPRMLAGVKVIQKLDSGAYVGIVPNDGTVEFEGKLYKYVVAKSLATGGFDQGDYFSMYHALSGLFMEEGIVTVKKEDGFETQALGVAQCVPNSSKAPKLTVAEASHELFRLIPERNRALAVTKAKSLLKNGADPNAIVSNGWETPFLAAATAGNSEMLKLMLENGADVKVQGGKALCLSAYHQDKLETLTLLLRAGASVDGDGTCSPLFVAASTENVEAVKALIATKADLDALVEPHRVRGKHRDHTKETTVLAYLEYEADYPLLQGDRVKQGKIAQMIKMLRDAGAKEGVKH